MEINYDNLEQYYTENYKKNGYAPASLGWKKGKQDIRFDILTSQYNCESKYILDIGCGFGDLNKILQKKFNKYKYLGIDIFNEFIVKAKDIYVAPYTEFKKINILDMKDIENFDFAIASGTFNIAVNGIDKYEYIEQIIKKTLTICKDGLAFDFLSDKVEYTLPETFHYAPEKILSIAYKYSRNIILRNDYMPFEFSLFIFKDDTFKKEDTLFNRYKELKSHK